jgi:hypothetical protein
VEAEILRDSIYTQVIAEVAKTDEHFPSAQINATAGYDHQQSTIMVTINDGTEVITSLADTGATIPLIRVDVVPNGAITKKLQRPVHLAGFSGTTAERVDTLVKVTAKTTDGAEFLPQWHYVVQHCNYGIIFSKGWLSTHECHWEMSSVQDRISLMSANRGRVSLDAIGHDENHQSVHMVQPRAHYKDVKFLNKEIDGEVMGRLVLTEDLEVKARSGEIPELKVRFVPETGGSD